MYNLTAFTSDSYTSTHKNNCKSIISRWIQATTSVKLTAAHFLKSFSP